VRLLSVLFLLLLAAGARPAAAQEDIPALAARVTDAAGVLTDEQRASLEQRLAAYEREKGSQVAVLIVPTTAPESIEQYSIRAVEQWKLGRKGVDDGALLLVALRDRRMRIEVGYGLEGVLPDIKARRIIDQIIAPHFKSGEFYQGIQAGLEAIISVISGEELPPPSAPAGGRQNWLVLLIFVLFPVWALLRGLLGAFRSAAIGGGAAFVLGLLTATVLAAVGAGILVFLVLLVLGLGGRSGRGGWASGQGAFGGGSRGGSSSGGGAFSGGGGGFGGGGASGGW